MQPVRKRLVSERGCVFARLLKARSLGAKVFGFITRLETHSGQPVAGRTECLCSDSAGCNLAGWKPAEEGT